MNQGAGAEDAGEESKLGSGKRAVGMVIYAGQQGGSKQSQPAEAF